MIFRKRYFFYEALTLVCSFATLLVALVTLVVKLIEIKTKK